MAVSIVVPQNQLEPVVREYVPDDQTAIIVTDGSELELDIPNVQVMNANADTVRGVSADVFFLYNVGTDHPFYRQVVVPCAAQRVYRLITTSSFAF